MWRPPQRIRFTASAGRVPSAAEAAASRLFSPIEIGPVRLAQRTWVPAMVPWRATEDGYVTDEVIAWYERFARGRPGAIVVEATGIRDVPSGPLLRIGHDRFLPGLRRLVETVRRRAAAARGSSSSSSIFSPSAAGPNRRNSSSASSRSPTAHRAALGGADLSDAEVARAPARARAKPNWPRVLDAATNGRRCNSAIASASPTCSLPHIRDLPQVLPGLFADAAARAEAGRLRRRRAALRARLHDGVVSLAHQYARRRLWRRAAKIACACRSRSLPRCARRVGKKFAVGCRFLAEECIDGGSDVERRGCISASPSRAPAWISSRPRAAASSTTPSSRPSAPPPIPIPGPAATNACRNSSPTSAGRSAATPSRRRRSARRSATPAAQTPVVCTGGIHNFEMAEDYLARGVCDIVGAARQSLADPDWFRKISLGLGGEVRVCEFTNYCEGLDQKHKPVTCQLWDKLPSQQGEARTPDGKRRMTAPAWQPPRLVFQFDVHSPVTRPRRFSISAGYSSSRCKLHDR